MNHETSTLRRVLGIGLAWAILWLFSGVAFGTLLSIGDRGRTIAGLSLIRVAGWGTLGCAIVQLAYLNHGDVGLAANIKMALLFCAFGGGVTVVRLVMARRWLRLTLAA